jgi:hypothetical protein
MSSPWEHRIDGSRGAARKTGDGILARLDVHA